MACVHAIGMGKNNFSLGSRDAAKAGAFSLSNAARAGEMSYSTAATVGDRWERFVEWAREEEGVKWMEDYTREMIIAYGRDLSERVAAGEMAPSTAQNYVSAVNTVMGLATQGKWESVSPTKSCGIAERSTIRDQAPGALDRGAYSRALDAVREQLGDRAAAVVELARELGLRSKEASLFNAKAALSEAIARYAVTISEGTKGGREREVPITSERQLEALKTAAQAQGSDRSLIPAEQTWKEWRAGDLRAAREIVQEHTGGGLHDLRASYACERYQAITGSPAPVAGGSGVDRAADREAREIIAAELGHGRTDVTNEYLGR
jgi:site-specific recombinase XerC